MADKILIDTQLMIQLSNQIQQLQRSLSGVHSEVTRSITEVRRIASGQTGTINKLNNAQKNLARVEDRAGKLAKATQQAAARWEETEKKISSQHIGEGTPGLEITGAIIDSIIKIFHFRWIHKL